MNIKSLILGACLFVSACAFKPLYEHRDDLMQQVATVHVEPVVGDGSYQLGLKVTSKLNPQHIQAKTKYRLKIQLSNPITTDGNIETDNFTTLEKMSLKISYQLFDIQQNKNVLSSSVSSNGMYSVTDSPYATEVAKDKIHQNLIDLLAEDIVMHVYTYFEELNGES